MHWTAQISQLWFPMVNCMEGNLENDQKNSHSRILFGIYFYDQGSISVQSHGETAALSFLLSAASRRKFQWGDRPGVYGKVLL